MEISQTSQKILTKPLEEKAVEVGEQMLKSGTKKITETFTQTETKQIEA